MITTGSKYHDPSFITCFYIIYDVADNSATRSPSGASKTSNYSNIVAQIQENAINSL